MNKFLFVLLLLQLTLFDLSAQSLQHNAVYLSGEVEVGNYLGVNLNLNYVLQEKYSLQFGVSGHVRKARSRPKDYQPGVFTYIPFYKAQDELETYHLSIGKIYKLNEKGTSRLNMLVGIGITQIKEPTNWEPLLQTGWLFTNYTFETQTSRSVSILINPKFEFIIARVVGATVSPILQINKERIMGGVGFGTMLGILRKKKEYLPR